MKKRLISMLLIASIVLQLLVGCAKGEKDQVTQGAMLAEICNAFGMYGYSGQTPYISSVSAGDPYFSVVQACVEWDIIPKDADYDVNKKVTRNDLALAVVNAAELAEEGDTDEEKLVIAAKHQLVEIKRNGEIKGEVTVSKEEVARAITAAQALWIGKTYDAPVEEVILREGVKDYGIDGKVITDYYKKAGKVYVPISSGIDIKAGDGYVLGDNGNGMMSGVAAEVKTEGDYYVITNRKFDDDLAELLAVVEDLKVQGTYAPNLLNSGTILDGNGNPVEIVRESGATANRADSPGASVYAGRLNSTGGRTGGNALALPWQLGNAPKGKIEFETPDGIEVSGSISSDSVEFEIEVPLDEKESGFSSKTAVKVSGLTPTVDIDIGWTGIKSASAKLDYDIEISESLGWKAKKEGELAKKTFPFDVKDTVSSVVGEAKRAQGSGAEKTVNIAKIPVTSVGVASLDIIIKAKISVSGSVEISVELGGTMGAEYKNGNLRFYKDSYTDADVALKAKLEATVGITFAAMALGKAVVGVSAEGGIGAAFSVVFNVVDAEGHLMISQTANGIGSDLADEIADIPIVGYVSDLVAAAELAGGYYNGNQDYDTKVELHLDPCVDIKVYFILKMGLSSDCLISKWIEGKANLEIEILGSGIDAAQWTKLHIDDFSFNLSDGFDAHVGTECSKTFTPWDEEKKKDELEEMPTEEKDAPVEKEPEHLVIDFSSFILTLHEGESSAITISRMPNGYSADDVQWASSDPSVASVDSNGTVKGVSAGSAVITALLKDHPEVKVSCSVNVLPDSTSASAVNQEGETGLTGARSSDLYLEKL